MGAYFQHVYFASTEQSRKNTVFLHNEFSRFFLGGGGGLVGWGGGCSSRDLELWPSIKFGKINRSTSNETVRYSMQQMFLTEKCEPRSKSNNFRKMTVHKPTNL